MPTYADEIAARQAAAAAAASGNNGSHVTNSRGSKGPVRLTISRGDAFVGPNGETYYKEEWEEEEIMETELVTSVDSELGFGNLGQADFFDSDRSGHHGRTSETLATSLQELGGALLVLDTNTLLAALPLLMTLFDQCLARNVFALENARFDRSPISLIVPHVVLSELDALKSMRSKSADSKTSAVASNAQAVNRWILTSLREQKKQSYHANTANGGHMSQVIPESAWALHVESSAHARARDGANRLGVMSADEEIVQFCVSLQRQTGLTVSFCSDDVNARLRAESDALATFSLTELMKTIEAEHKGTRHEALASGAADLIEQWGAQLGIETSLPDYAYTQASSSRPNNGGNVMTTLDTMEVEAPASLSLPITHANGSHNAPVWNPEGRSVQQSEYARPAARSPPRRRQSPTQSRKSTTNNAKVNENESSYEYPADRSTASSRWAR